MTWFWVCLVLPPDAHIYESQNRTHFIRSPTKISAFIKVEKNALLIFGFKCVRFCVFVLLSRSTKHDTQKRTNKSNHIKDLQ